MNAERVSRARAGFTLVELMIASLIFAMVIAGLAAIFSTAYSQGGRVMSGTRQQAMANASMRSITRDVSLASRIDIPARNPPNNTGSVLTGCHNFAPDGQNIQSLINTTGVTDTAPRTFGYCVEQSVGPNCPAAVPAGSPQGCLFYYRWDATCFVPGLTPGTCGQRLGASEFTLIATDVEISPAMPYFFSRTVADAGGENGVRVAFQVTRQATANQPPYKYPVDLALDSQFNGMWP